MLHYSLIFNEQMNRLHKDCTIFLNILFKHSLEHILTIIVFLFQMYFQYLQSWLYHLQNLPDASRTLKNPLEEEWSFTKKICPHIIGGEAEAGKRFR